ncbi:DUF2255 family protein [Kribbella shirazensis]|uniref:DUF2255 family protein n=1 Tax=Kribbella shirazensis TaxID=1105143 RepID=A0A7X5VK03_9ACTN|nr:DUF2255 family protein [Kribbella shirazensis]NIK61523.1 hypothetical protein [Kribbella shirazensis]
MDNSLETTAGWTPEELSSVGRADELQVSSYRRDGTLRTFVTIWNARVGDAIYIRSAHGPANGWYRRALVAGAGRIRAGGTERDVRFDPLDASDPAQSAIDEAYHAKYDRYGPRYVATVVGPSARQTTLRIVPAQ